MLKEATEKNIKDLSRKNSPRKQEEQSLNLGMALLVGASNDTNHNDQTTGQEQPSSNIKDGIANLNSKMKEELMQKMLGGNFLQDLVNHDQFSVIFYIINLIGTIQEKYLYSSYNG